MAGCKIERPSAQGLWQKTQDMFSSTVLGGSPVIPESNEYYVAANDYAMAEEFYSLSEQQWRERDPRYACCENLVDMASKDGVYPYPASPAQGYVEITGTAGAALQQNMQFQIKNQMYIPAGTVPAAVPSSGRLTLRLVAITPGPDGNLDPNTTIGTITTPLPGVNSTVTIFGGQFCGGGLAETCEQFRTRYLDRSRYKPRATLDWIKQKILEWPCVSRVCERAGSCCTGATGGINNCSGNLELYVLFDGSFACGLAPQSVIDEMNTWLFGTPQGYGLGQLEWGVCGQLFTAQPASINVGVFGAGCLTPAEQTTITERIADYIDRLCPSEILNVRQLDTTVAQLVGDAAFSVVIDPLDANSTRDLCGDVTPVCDYRLCLNNVTFNATLCVNC